MNTPLVELPVDGGVLTIPRDALPSSLPGLVSPPGSPNTSYEEKPPLRKREIKYPNGTATIIEHDKDDDEVSDDKTLDFATATQLREAYLRAAARESVTVDGKTTRYRVRTSVAPPLAAGEDECCEGPRPGPGEVPTQSVLFEALQDKLSWLTELQTRIDRRETWLTATQNKLVELRAVHRDTLDEVRSLINDVYEERLEDEEGDES